MALIFLSDRIQCIKCKWQGEVQKCDIRTVGEGKEFDDCVEIYSCPSCKVNLLARGLLDFNTFNENVILLSEQVYK